MIALPLEVLRLLAGSISSHQVLMVRTLNLIQRVGWLISATESHHLTVVLRTKPWLGAEGKSLFTHRHSVKGGGGAGGGSGSTGPVWVDPPVRSSLRTSRLVNMHVHTHAHTCTAMYMYTHTSTHARKQAVTHTGTHTNSYTLTIRSSDYGCYCVIG